MTIDPWVGQGLFGQLGQQGQAVSAAMQRQRSDGADAKIYGQTMRGLGGHGIVEKVLSRQKTYREELQSEIDEWLR